MLPRSTISSSEGAEATDEDRGPAGDERGQLGKDGALSHEKPAADIPASRRSLRERRRCVVGSTMSAAREREGEVLRPGQTRRVRERRTIALVGREREGEVPHPGQTHRVSG